VQVVVKLAFQDVAELMWPVSFVREGDPVVAVLSSVVVVVVDSAGLLEQVAVSLDVAAQFFWALVTPNWSKQQSLYMTSH